MKLFSILFILLFSFSGFAGQKKISDLTSQTAAGIASDDLMVVVDTDATASKKISFTELDKYFIPHPSSDGAANYVLVTDGSKGVSWSAGLTLNSLILTNQGDLYFYEAGGGNYVGFQAPSSVGGNYLHTWPDGYGTNGYQLTTDGAGVLTWEAAGSGGGGVDTVFTRSGDVVAATSDYDADQIDNTAAGNIAATNVQDAIDELDDEKAALTGAVFTGGVQIDNQYDLRLYEGNGNGDHYVSLYAPSSLTASYNFQFPGDDGDSGECLQTNGSGVLTWDSCGGGGGAFSGGDFFDEYAAKTANYTVLDTDFVLTGDSSGGTFTFTLPTGASGQRLIFKKTDSSFTKIDVGTVADLNTEGESVTLVYTGSAWIVESRYIPSGWTAYTPGSNWSAAASVNSGMWKRVGDSIIIRHYMTLSGAPSGNYNVDLPTGVDIDTTKALTNYNYLANVYGHISFNAGGQSSGFLSGSDADTLSCRYMTSPGSSSPVGYGNCSPTAPVTFATGHNIFAVSYPIPVDGWED